MNKPDEDTYWYELDYEIKLQGRTILRVEAGKELDEALNEDIRKNPTRYGLDEYLGHKFEVIDVSVVQKMGRE